MRWLHRVSPLNVHIILISILHCLCITSKWFCLRRGVLNDSWGFVNLKNVNCTHRMRNVPSSQWYYHFVLQEHTLIIKLRTEYILKHNMYFRFWSYKGWDKNLRRWNFLTWDIKLSCLVKLVMQISHTAATFLGLSGAFSSSFSEINKNNRISLLVFELGLNSDRVYT